MGLSGGITIQKTSFNGTCCLWLQTLFDRTYFESHYRHAKILKNLWSDTHPVPSRPSKNWWSQIFIKIGQNVAKHLNFHLVVKKSYVFFIKMGKTSHFVFCPIKECWKNAHTPGPTFLSLRENRGVTTCYN